jgi:hypothetical protein
VIDKSYLDRKPPAHARARTAWVDQANATLVDSAAGLERAVQIIRESTQRWPAATLLIALALGVSLSHTRRRR